LLYVKDILAHMSTPTLSLPLEFDLVKVIVNGNRPHVTAVTANNSIANVIKLALQKSPPAHIIATAALSLFGVDIHQLNKRETVGVDGYKPQLKTKYFSLTGHDKIDAAMVQFKTLRKSNDVLQHGKIEQCNVASYKSDLHSNAVDGGVVAFAKTLAQKQFMMIYNPSPTEPEEKFIMLDNAVNCNTQKLEALYGFERCTYIQVNHSTLLGKAISCIKLYLKPLHFILLKNF